MGIISLLSDFGSASLYPAEMKAVLHERCRATLVDITHDVPAHDVAAGAHVLLMACPGFPAGTVHLAVVDPGVGTGRLPLAVASGGHLFVGPDNGLLMVPAEHLGRPRAFAIDTARFARRPLSATFHGRDLFAPVAAVLAGGLPIERVGRAVPAPVMPRVPQPRREGHRLVGQVLYRDRFGNLITNIPAGWQEVVGGAPVLESPAGDVPVRLVATYGEGEPGETLLLIGSGGTLEIAVRNGRASDVLALGPGRLVTIRST